MTLWTCRTLLRMAALHTMFLMALSLPLSATADSTDRWQTLTEAGIAARDGAQYDEAERLFLLARREAERFGANATRMATTLNDLGLVYHAQGQYARAKSYYEKALAQCERAVGSEQADVSTLLNNLAEIYREEGNFEQAETFYLRSLAIGERVLGRGHPELAMVYNNLGSLYRKQGRLAQAETWFHLALSYSIR